MFQTTAVAERPPRPAGYACEAVSRSQIAALHGLPSAGARAGAPTYRVSLPTSIVDVKPFVPECDHVWSALVCVCDTDLNCV